jgi:hypothetical protein
VPLFFPPFPDAAQIASVRNRLFPVQAVTGRAADAANRIPWPNLIGRDSLAFQILAIETDDGGDGLASGGHIHKSEAPGPLTMPVLHHVRRFNLAERFKNIEQIVLRDIARQITYIDIHSFPRSFAGFMPEPQQ